MSVFLNFKDVFEKRQAEFTLTLDIAPNCYKMLRSESKRTIWLTKLRLFNFCFVCVRPATIEILIRVSEQLLLLYTFNCTVPIILLYLWLFSIPIQFYNTKGKNNYSNQELNRKRFCWSVGLKKSVHHTI